MWNKIELRLQSTNTSCGQGFSCAAREIKGIPAGWGEAGLAPAQQDRAQQPLCCHQPWGTQLWGQPHTMGRRHGELSPAWNSCVKEKAEESQGMSRGQQGQAGTAGTAPCCGYSKFWDGSMAKSLCKSQESRFCPGMEGGAGLGRVWQGSGSAPASLGLIPRAASPLRAPCSSLHEELLEAQGVFVWNSI